MNACLHRALNYRQQVIRTVYSQTITVFPLRNSNKLAPELQSSPAYLVFYELAQICRRARLALSDLCAGLISITPPENAELHAVFLSWAWGAFNIQTAQFRGDIAPHFCYFAEAGFLLTVRGGVKVVVTDSMRKCFGQDLKQRILIVPFVLCPKSCWWTVGGYLILRILMKSLSERLFLDLWVNLIILRPIHSFLCCFSFRCSHTTPALFQGTSDFCVSPDKYLLSQTKGIIGTGELYMNNAALMEL